MNTSTTSPEASTIYNLCSTEWVDSPSIVEFCIEGYKSTGSKAKREKFVDILKAWKLPENACHALLSKSVIYTITENRTVRFSL